MEWSYHSTKRIELDNRIKYTNKEYDVTIIEIKEEDEINCEYFEYEDNDLKDKELKETKEIMKKNASLIELLGEKISNYEKTISELKERQNLEEEEAIKTGDEKYIALIENNKNK